MVLDLVLMLSWIVIGIIGGVWLNRKGYFSDPPGKPKILSDHAFGEVNNPEFGRIFLPALGGPITLLVALLLPGKVRHTV